MTESQDQWLDELESLSKSGRLPFESGKLIEAAPRLIAIARASRELAETAQDLRDHIGAPTITPYAENLDAALAAYKEAVRK